MTATSPAAPETERLTHPKYRPDIDGLRAVAVLSVVGFHAFPEVIRGGFVGVDVFFVISGYLISTIILTNLTRGSFSFTEFYSRRVRRIFPALAAVLMFCLVAGWFLLLAEEYRLLGKHVAAGAGFISNFALWRESGYFDAAAEMKPLLHLWSLGIEEQFYIVWPLLLWLCWKKRWSFATATLGIAILSFAVNILTYRKSVIANFYSPQSRFWELLIGAGLAYIVLNRDALSTRLGPWRQSRLTRLATPDMLSVLGGLLIVLAVGLLSKSRHFPGFWALLPTLGAAFIIHAGPEALVNRRLLSHPLMVWFGLISFPLYLWHWPLLAFPRIIDGDTPSLVVRCGAIVASVALAWLTFRFIERPLRFGGNARAKTMALAGALLLLAGAGLGIFMQKGMPARSINDFGAIKAGSFGHDAFFDHMAAISKTCTDKSLSTTALLYEGHIRCMQTKVDRPIDMVVLGDSHAEHLFPGLAEALPGRNVAYHIMAATPVLGIKDYEAIFRAVMNEPAIRTVLLGAHWKTRKPGLPRGRSFDNDLTTTIQALQGAGKTVLLIDDIPDYGFQPARCKAARVSGGTRPCSEPADVFARTLAAYLPSLEAVAAATGVRLLRIGPEFCRDGLCSMERDGALLYRDENHLNLEGSRFVAGVILKQAPELSQ